MADVSAVTRAGCVWRRGGAVHAGRCQSHSVLIGACCIRFERALKDARGLARMTNTWPPRRIAEWRGKGRCGRTLSGMPTQIAALCRWARVHRYCRAGIGRLEQTSATAAYWTDQERSVITRQAPARRADLDGLWECGQRSWPAQEQEHRCAEQETVKTFSTENVRNHV